MSVIQTNRARPGSWLDKQLGVIMSQHHPLVLIADDSLPVITVYSRQLQSYGIDTVHAFTLHELDDVFDTHADEIDVIILDGCIPGNSLNTIEFIERVRSAGFDKPIIAASSLPRYRKQMVRAGASYDTEKNSAPELAYLLILETS